MRRERDEAGVVRAVVEAAFGADGSHVADLWVDVVRSGDARASLVADDEGVVVGHVGLSRGWVDARRALVEVWVLSPLSARPDVQRRGVGAALLAAALDEARSAGVPAVLLEGDPGYYGRRGFVPGHVLGVERWSERVPPDAFQVAVLDGWEPWMAGRAVLPGVWWRHDAVGLRDPAPVDALPDDGGPG